MNAAKVIILIVVGLLIWGGVGAYAAQEPGVTCDMGVGGFLCWKWHTNTYGKVAEFVENIGG